MNPLPDAFEAALSSERAEPVKQLAQLIENHVDGPLEPNHNNAMLNWVVPLSFFPEGYHCKAETPLPFISLASQKRAVSLYHMGLYANKELHNWFITAYPQHAKYKLDMGKSCIRFKRMDDIPFNLLQQLFERMGAQEWVTLYKKSIA